METATRKAKDLVRIAVARSVNLQAQSTIELPVNRSGLVVGGGAAGIAAALSLAQQGFPVHLVEKTGRLGGNLLNTYIPRNGKNPQDVLTTMLDELINTPNIAVHLNSQVIETGGFSGNFTTTIQRADGSRQEIAHGATILAVGGEEYRGNDYLYGEHPDILTQQEFEHYLHSRPEEAEEKCNCYQRPKPCCPDCRLVQGHPVLWIQGKTVHPGQEKRDFIPALHQ